MADDQFQGVVIAAGVQAAFGTPLAAIVGLTGTIDETDGLILGDKNSGDADSGVTIPQLNAIFREVAAVPASFTESADSFQRADVTGFSVTFALQGNGEVGGTPTAGAADFDLIHPGIEAIWETMGLIGADGSAPVESYTPRHSGSTGGTGPDGATVYSTWKIWHGPLEMVYSDCLIESADFAFEPGGNCLVTCNVVVGTFDHTVGVDVDSFPTASYGSQATQAAPVVEGVNFTWGGVRGFEKLVISITNKIEQFGDSNVPVTGKRQAQTGRRISVSGTLYVESAYSDFEFQNMVDSDAPTVDLSLQLGTVTGASPDTCNAFLITVKKLQAKSIKYNKVGDAFVCELGDSKATATVAGGEFILLAN